MPVIQLPLIKMNGKRYFQDNRLKQFRNVENPHDIVEFEEAFVRVRISYEYIALNDPDMIQKAKDALLEDLAIAFRHSEIQEWIDTEPAPDGSMGDIPEHILDEEEREEDEDA